MMSIINLPNHEKIIDDLNNLVFNTIEPKSSAGIVWQQCEDLIYGGATEEFMYNYVYEVIEQYEESV